MFSEEAALLNVAQQALVVVLLHLAFRTIAQTFISRFSGGLSDDLRRELVDRLDQIVAIGHIASDLPLIELVRRNVHDVEMKLSRAIGRTLKLLFHLRTLEAILVYSFGVRLITLNFEELWRSHKAEDVLFELKCILYFIISIHVVFIWFGAATFFLKTLAKAKLKNIVSETLSSQVSHVDRSLEQILSDKLSGSKPNDVSESNKPHTPE